MIRESLQPAADRRIRSDFASLYSPNGLALVAEGMAVGATLAHTDADEDVRDWWQNDVRGDATDDLAGIVEPWGDGHVLLPALAGSLLVSEFAPRTRCTQVLGDWSDRSLRSILVGAPLLVFGQSATGASRPSESSAGSDWKPFHDNNGVSGHAFMGAVPCITAAQMSENPWEKAGWYCASTLTAWSRVNDDAHYTSQAMMGWWMAYLSCCAVSQTELERQNVRFTAVPMPGGVGVGVILTR